MLVSSGSYTKLKDGSWGIRVEGDVRPGQMVEVSTKAGQKKREQADKVLWSGRDKFTGKHMSLCTIRSNRQSVPSGGFVKRQPSQSRGYGKDRRFPGWDGVIGSPSYYSSGAFDEYDM